MDEINNFAKLKEVVADMQKLINDKALNDDIKYTMAGSFSENAKNYATKLFENKAWMKIFGPMTVTVIAVTLLAQKFFGNIKKDFPEENKKGVQA